MATDLYCSKCGKKHGSEGNYCSKCGNLLNLALASDNSRDNNNEDREVELVAGVKIRSIKLKSLMEGVEIIAPAKPKVGDIAPKNPESKAYVGESRRAPTEYAEMDKRQFVKSFRESNKPGKMVDVDEI